MGIRHTADTWIGDKRLVMGPIWVGEGWGCSPPLPHRGPEGSVQQLSTSICQLCGCVRKFQSCSKICLPTRLRNHWSRAGNKFPFQKLHFSELISCLPFMPSLCRRNLPTLISSLTLFFLPRACLCLNFADSQLLCYQSVLGQLLPPGVLFS